MSSSFAKNTLPMAALLTVLTSSQGLLTTASKTKGTYAYNFATVPFLAELVKLFISWNLLQQQKRDNPDQARMTKDWKTVLLFPVPSLIYGIHNNVQFHFLKYVDPATYQILGNLKIVSTGVLLRLCLQRRLSLLQWMALVLLMVGATTSQINTDCSGGAEKSFLSAPLQGYLFGLLSALLSAVAAVYTEWVMKSNNDSLYWQNCLLYSFGVLFNGAGLVFSGGSGLDLSVFSHKRIFEGYTSITWLVVCNLAFSGLLVSWVMKFADSIVKVYATSLAMLLTTVVSILCFGLEPTLPLGLGILVASISVVLYYVSPARLAQVDSPRVAGHYEKLQPFTDTGGKLPK
ncbi:hypothetical protein N2152v2_009809 [Parachlorella kessleri]